MRSRQLLVLLVILGVCLNLVAGQCPLFTDPKGSCVEDCDLSQIKDAQNRKCLESASQCPGVIMISRNTCLKECPPKTTLGFSQPLNKNVCVDIDVAGLYPNSASLKCAEKQLRDLKGNQCVALDKCNGKAIMELQICLSDCPTGFTEFKAQIDNTFIPSCKPNPYQYITPNTCMPPMVIDYVTNTCINKSECKGFLYSDKNKCSVGCQEGSYKIFDEPYSNAYKLCTFCPIQDTKGKCYSSCPEGTTEDAFRNLCLDSSLKCDPALYIDIVTPTCLDQPQYCKYYVLQSKRLCISECPLYHIYQEQTVNNMKYKECMPCRYKDPAGLCVEKCPPELVVDDQAGKCVQPSCEAPKVKDIVNNTCLSGPEQCNNYFIKSSMTCEVKCPENHQITESIYNNVITKVCVPCTLKDIKGNCYEKCPPPLVVDSTGKLCVENTCISPKVMDKVNNVCLDGPEKCKYYFIKASMTCEDKCPENHQITESIYNSVIIKVCVPCPLKDIKGNCYTTCPPPLVADSTKKLCVEQSCLPPQVYDVQNKVCLQNIEFCKGFFLKSEYTCLQKCPDNYTIQEITNATFKICLPCNFKDDKGNCYEQCPSNLVTNLVKKTCSEPQTPILKCETTQIIDFVNNVCLDSPSYCKNYFIKSQNVCVEKCPELHKVFEIQFNNVIVKACNPCFFQDESGNCYDQCPSTMRVDKEKRICIKDAYLSCTGYYVKQTSQCLNTCPFGYDAVITTTKPNICVPCTTSACFANSKCALFLSSSKTVCADLCPPSEYPTAKVADQSYIQCQKCSTFISSNGQNCVKECDVSEVINVSTRKCIKQTECQTFVYKQGTISYCGKECPYNQIATLDGNNKYKLCVSCKTGEYVDQTTKTCIPKCTLYDSNGVNCLKSINDCRGFITVDKNYCQKECSGNEYYIQISKTQNQCVVACPSDLFISNQLCTNQCPKGTYADEKTKKCESIKNCTGVVSIDGLNCLGTCPLGQFPQYGNYNLKYCKICNQRLSSDGLTCGKECGASDVYDLDLQKCLNSFNSTTCQGKVYSSDKKSCSKSCAKGQLLLSNSDGTQICLKSINDCPYYVSSDYQQCVRECYGDKEVALLRGNTKVCIYCQYGPNTKKDGCATSQQCDSLTQKLDLDLKVCVPNESCVGKYISTDGKKCSTKCVYPDVSRSASTTQCFPKCETNELYDREKGCIVPNTCQYYLSSNEKNCIEECIYLKEAIDVSASNPNRCKKCLETEIPTVVDSGALKVIECQPIPVATNDDTTTQQSTTTLKSVLDYIPKIQPEQKNEIKQNIVSVASKIEETIKATGNNLELSETQKKEQIQSLIKNVRQVAEQFVKKIEQANSESDTSISLGQSEFQLVAEKKKEGFQFKVNFVLQDFFSASPPSLQTDPSQSTVSTLTNYVNTNIQTLSAINLAKNPYCSTGCSSYGLFTVDYTLISNKKRLLQQSNDQPTFQLTYNVDPAKINKSVCISYDEETGAISPAVKTTTDKENNQITCLFNNNSDLFYDNDCSIIDKSACSNTTENNNQTFNDVVTFGTTINFLVATFAILLSVF